MFDLYITFNNGRVSHYRVDDFIAINGILEAYSSDFKSHAKHWDLSKIRKWDAYRLAPTMDIDYELFVALSKD